MTTKRLLPSLALLAVSSLVACSDQPPATVDAPLAACTCPSAEPPLAGRITYETKSVEVLGGTAGNTGSCANPDAILLGGGCDLDVTDTVVLAKVHLIKSYRSAPDSWECAWDNQNSGMTLPGIITLTCLNPAQ
jgi:hypothetical protein